MATGEKRWNYGKPVTRYSTLLAGCLVFLFLTFGVAPAQAEWPHVVTSKDGTPISYEIQGDGEPTLVFVHGWSCDARYWRAQLPYFAKDHRVVTLDLAGHGHSGMKRSQYTMRAFGEDVQAVTEATSSRRVILIGLIGIDTLENIEYPLTQEGFDQMIAPLKKDFQTGSRKFAEQMMLPGTDSQLREWILSDMSAAPPAVALSAMDELLSQYITGEAARIFDEIRIPVITVNADMWPIDYEANRRHMFSYDAIVLKGADHFLMMNRPEEFNRALEKAIQMLVKKPVT